MPIAAFFNESQFHSMWKIWSISRNLSIGLPCDQNQCTCRYLLLQPTTARKERTVRYAWSCVFTGNVIANYARTCLVITTECDRSVLSTVTLLLDLNYSNTN